MKKIILGIDGMSCSACSNGLEKYLNKQDNITSATVNLVMATAYIEYNDNTPIETLEKYISEAGFKSTGPKLNIDNEKKESKIPYIIFGTLALLLMYISMSHMANLPVIPFLNMEKEPINYSICLFIMTIPFIFFGFNILLSGIKNLIHKMPNMDTLVGIGIISSFLYSTFSTIMVLYGNNEYIHQLYFESTAFVILFIKIGRFIDSSSKSKTKEVIKSLVTITPTVATIEINNEIKEITIDEVKENDILICLPGSKIAVDGEIVEGISHFDESFITGESKPIEKQTKDKVIAGSINYEGVIKYKAEKIGKDSMISEMVRLVVEATNTKAPISLLADKISSYFVPIIIILATLTLCFALILGNGFNESLTRFVTVLVVACPCALGLATPLAMVVSIGYCAKNGILIKKSSILEIANKINTVVFDKTGTLTNGTLTISKIINYSNKTEKELLKIAASLEYNSTHPIGIGIMNYTKEKNINDYNSLKINNMPGYGVKGSNNKNIYYACNSKLLKKLEIINSHKKEEVSLTEEGNSIVYLLENQKILALIGIKDIERSESKDVIEKLNNIGIETIMLTGDNEIVSNLIGKRLNINRIISNVLPQEKNNYIKKLKKENKKVMMIGDGINDAPSLSLADIGVSLSSGTDIATSAADVVLINNNLNKIVDLITISKATIKNIKQNLFWAFIYNCIMIPIAMGVFTKINITINPMIACVAMIISSLFVILNALRLRNLKIGE